LAKRPSAQFANSTYKNNPQALEIATALLQAKEGSQPNEPPSCRKEQELPSHFFRDSLNTRKQKNTTNDFLTRTDFQHFFNKAPRSSFKKVIISMLLKSLGIPTPRNPHYQVMVIPVCLSPQIFQITDYLAYHNFCSNTLHTTTTVE
jgi:hypothetical protein